MLQQLLPRSVTAVLLLLSTASRRRFLLVHLLQTLRQLQAAVDSQILSRRQASQ